MDNYILYFDGCSKGNPGKGGCGAVIYKNNEEIWSGTLYLGMNITNNVAEYNGLLLGLNEAINRNIHNLIVRGDSLLIIHQMTGWYNIKSNNLIELYNEVKKLEKCFSKIEFEHVKRNNNKRADELSNKALIGH